MTWEGCTLLRELYLKMDTLTRWDLELSPFEVSHLGQKWKECTEILCVVLATHYSVLSSYGHNALTAPHSACVLDIKLTPPWPSGVQCGTKVKSSARSTSLVVVFGSWSGIQARAVQSGQWDSILGLLNGEADSLFCAVVDLNLLGQEEWWWERDRETEREIERDRKREANSKETETRNKSGDIISPRNRALLELILSPNKHISRYISHILLNPFGLSFRSLTNKSVLTNITVGVIFARKVEKMKPSWARDSPTWYSNSCYSLWVKILVAASVNIFNGWRTYPFQLLMESTCSPSCLLLTFTAHLLTMGPLQVTAAYHRARGKTIKCLFFNLQVVH